MELEGRIAFELLPPVAAGHALDVHDAPFDAKAYAPLLVGEDEAVAVRPDAAVGVRLRAQRQRLRDRSFEIGATLAQEGELRARTILEAHLPRGTRIGGCEPAVGRVRHDVRVLYIRFQIEDGRPVEQIDVAHAQQEPVDREQAKDRQPDGVGPMGRARREHALARALLTLAADAGR